MRDDNFTSEPPYRRLLIDKAVDDFKWESPERRIPSTGQYDGAVRIPFDGMAPPRPRTLSEAIHDQMNGRPCPEPLKRLPFWSRFAPYEGWPLYWAAALVWLVTVIWA